MSDVPEGQEVVYGGPYIQESEAIEAELLHAHIEDREPDLWGVFKGKQITNGAVALIKTYLEGHPNAGYEGERVSGENYEPPTPDYVAPGDGGVNTVDLESSPTLTVDTLAQAEEAPAIITPTPDVADGSEYQSVIADAVASVEESPVGKHVSTD